MLTFLNSIGPSSVSDRLRQRADRLRDATVSPVSGGTDILALHAMSTPDKVALQLKHLVTPAGMGESFHALIMAKGVEAGALSGLKFAG